VSSLAAQPDRRVLVLVNPFGGSGKAVRIFQRDVVPIFAESGLQYQLVVTGLIRFCVDFFAKLTHGSYTLAVVNQSMVYVLSFFVLVKLSLLAKLLARKTRLSSESSPLYCVQWDVKLYYTIPLYFVLKPKAGLTHSGTIK